jgi:pimeloyl-ACP methyl ester carboxylesterase
MKKAVMIYDGLFHFHEVNGTMQRDTLFSDGGNGEALVFFHAFPLNAMQWLDQLDHFQKKYRVIAFNLHALLLSESIFAPSFAGLATKCIHLLKDAGIHRFVQIGSSMGGYLAMAMLRDFPDAIAGTVFANTRVGADTEAIRNMRLRQIETIRLAGTKPITEELLPKLIGVASSVRNPQIPAFVHSLSEEMPAEAMTWFLSAMAQRTDSTEMLLSYSGPVCVIAGGEDVLTPPEALMELHSVCFSSEYHIIAETGHLTNIEAPEKFNDIMQRFLEKICYGFDARV